MKQSKFGIVITAYNRAVPLKHLLETLNAIKTEIDNIPLIISIDNKGTEEVNKIANDFNWIHGQKKVIIHQEKKDYELILYGLEIKQKSLGMFYF